MMKSLQEIHAPTSVCFGCGPTNEKGLRIKSFVEGEALVAEWRPEDHHKAFDGILNGGICGALLDCHSNWCAAWSLMRARGVEALPFTVTASFSVTLRRPTPMDAVLRLKAWAVEIDGDRATIEATIEAGGKITASCHGVFVSVKEGHPAFRRW